MSAPRIRVESLSRLPLADLGTFMARVALAGFAVFLLALATHGA